MSALRNQAKQWFQTNDKPTEEQFAAFLNSIRFNDEPIALSEVTQLIPVLNGLANPVENYLKNTSDGADFLYTLPQSFLLESMVISVPSDTQITVTKNGEELFTDEDVTIDGNAFALLIPAINADVNIVISGLPVNTQLTFIKRKIR
ncbi:hypothetical protein ACFOWM_06335 [Ferruginibacter yonginensis]|uniref:Uncharacterized protein n=1 Tax=Ferruginibacter yonginensis TaxID=1310416 RepID=A0ABV8QQC5_9BACT